MNVFAYHPSDPGKDLVHIDQWLTLYGPHVAGRCRICHQAMTVTAAKSQRQTHFSHANNSRCPSVVVNHVPYANLQNLPRDPALAANAKAYTLKNIEALYLKMKGIDKSLSWKEMIGFLEIAKRERVWELKDMPLGCIPYVLLTCADRLSANNFGRATDVFFVLEASPQQGSFWNFPVGYKRLLWEVALPSRNVTSHVIDLANPTAKSSDWYMRKIEPLLL